MVTKTKPELCPTCEGFKLPGDKQCATCFDTGLVYPGEPPCWFCGRSIQVEYKGEKICGSKICIEETDKLANRRATFVDRSPVQNDELTISSEDDEETIRWKMSQYFN